MHRRPDHTLLSPTTAPGFRAIRVDDQHDAATQASLQLRRIAGPDASGIRVHRDGEVVRLTGRVPRWHLKQLATATVRNLAADAIIENELTVCG